MRLIFIYGLPATGKLTVAQELANLTGYKLFHNHLVVDLLLSTFEFGSSAFIELREQIWLSIFDQASLNGLDGMIFTFNPESTVRASFLEKVQEVMDRNRSAVDFVELVCPLDELKRRIDSPSRSGFKKLSSLTLFEELHAAGTFDTAYMPEPKVSIDTSLYRPADTAAQIQRALDLM